MADTRPVSMAATDAQGRTAALLLAIEDLQKRGMAELLVTSKSWPASVTAPHDLLFAVSCIL